MTRSPEKVRSESSGSKPQDAALGSKRRYVDASGDEGAKQRRRDRFADQRKAAEIYRSMADPAADKKQAGRGVTMCGWTQIAGQTIRLVCVEPHKQTSIKGGKIESREMPSRAFFRGLQVCGLRWVCPCCTIKRSEAVRAELNAALAEGRKRGLQPVMLTLTARHKRSMSLAYFYEKIALAEKRMKTTRHWKRLMKIATGGFAKAVEATFGANGWHPHFHIILLLDSGNQANAFEDVEELRDAWLHELNRVGLDGKSEAAKDRSFDYCGAEEAGEYVSKWGAGEEMTLASTKVGHGEGRTPWQLLRDARTAETETERQKAAALWWEFIQVMKGVHQLRQSPAFREIVAEYEPPKIAEQVEPVEYDIFEFDNGGADRLWVFARFRRVRLMEAAENGLITGAHQRVVAAILDERTDEDFFKQPVLIESG